MNLYSVRVLSGFEEGVTPKDPSGFDRMYHVKARSIFDAVDRALCNARIDMDVAPEGIEISARNWSAESEVIS